LAVDGIGEELVVIGEKVLEGRGARQGRVGISTALDPVL
jgi:hypothetical protein